MGRSSDLTLLHEPLKYSTLTYQEAIQTVDVNGGHVEDRQEWLCLRSQSRTERGYNRLKMEGSNFSRLGEGLRSLLMIGGLVGRVAIIWVTNALNPLVLLCSHAYKCVDLRIHFKNYWILSHYSHFCRVDSVTRQVLFFGFCFFRTLYIPHTSLGLRG